jgi:hypothetical protein
MALYLTLPVYKASYDLLLNIFQVAKNFPKEYKYSLGQELRQEGVNLIKAIYRINSEEKKIENFFLSRSAVESIRLYLRLSYDLRIINLNKFVMLSEKNELVSKQLSAWKKYYQGSESSKTKVF